MNDATSLSRTILLRDGRAVTFRPLRHNDLEPLAAYFLGLTDATKQFYGPHRFDRDMAEQLCAALPDPETTRFVAVLAGAEGNPQIIGYMILSRKIATSDRERYGEALAERVACFAPSMAEAFQNQGLGQLMAKHVLDCGSKMGLQQVILMGGVQARNARARHLYEKLGFRSRGEFWTHKPVDLLNYDMVLTY